MPLDLFIEIQFFTDVLFTVSQGTYRGFSPYRISFFSYIHLR